MKIIIITLTFFYSSIIFCQEFAMPNNDPNYLLYFQDQFNSLNTSIWNFHVWSPQLPVPISANADKDPPTFTNRINNVKVLDGKLLLTIIRENYNGYKFTSGGINSKQAFSKGCYFESYCKIAPGNACSAFWTWNGNYDCPNNDYREIDILEWYPDPQSSTANLHFCDFSTIGKITSAKTNYNINNPLYYHKYGCYWTSRNITHFLDEKSIPHTERKTQPASMLNSMFLTFSNNKGNWGDYSLNATFEVDYVKVWRLKNCENININNISDFSTYNFTVKRSITLGSNTTLPNNQNISLRASSFIEFKDGLIIPNSSKDIVFNTNECD